MKQWMRAGKRSTPPDSPSDPPKPFNTTMVAPVRSFHLLPCIAVSIVCWLGVHSSAGRAQDASPALQLQGEYLKGNRGIQAAAIGEDEFRVSYFNGGLPGSGWDRSPVQTIEMDSDALRDAIEGAVREERTSPSMGAIPPSGAIPLFDGTASSLEKHWRTGAKLVEGNLLLAGVTTKETFRDYRLHLEFRTPFVPKAEGQGRGNSGVYHQGRYETQVLDSFGFENEGNTCGAIYGVQAADFNACLPPLAWQTYDVEFVAARWDASGKKIADAKLSVWLNGFPIHREQSVPGSTTAAPYPESPEAGPLYLQDHGNPVTYRNVWLVPLDADELALRPRVAGFERLAASSGGPKDLAISGRLLLGELGCFACHTKEESLGAIDRKSAPLLEQAGGRLRPGYVASMLEDVHGSKIGTTMPDVLHGMAMETKADTIQALAAYLESSGKSRRHSRSDRQAAERGAQLYAKVGCAVCHGFPDGTKVTSTSVPLPDLSKKYAFDGLALFLKQPHQVRPSNRMPGMHLDDNEVRDLTHYLLPAIDPADVRPDTRYRIYHGGWNKIPDMDKLEPAYQGTCEGFDLGVAQRNNNYAVRFDSFFTLDQASRIRFHLGSDDGSRLFVDGQAVVDVDGIHPHQTSTGEVQLEAGTHHVRVEYFQGGGEATLEVQWESQHFVRQSMEGWLSLDRDGAKKADDSPSVTPEWIEKGKQLFTSVGCVQCHAAKGLPQATESLANAKSLSSSTLDGGCMADEPPSGAPKYRLSLFQKEAIRAALKSSGDSITAAEHAKLTLAKLNCIACHQRDQWGGPESHQLELFTSSIPEMGDEGRLPPRLTGVGDKLNDAFLQRVLSEGVRHRPYMLVRMPQYRNATAGLADHWKQVDRPNEETVAHAANEPEVRTIAAGRQLAGIKGLSCAQCHTFGNERAIGIQAINLLTMTERLRPEWFYRYLMEPTRYRPGTRMPASFPEGVSVLKSVYDGNAEHQIAAMWKYLSQGSEASIPEGLARNQMVLEPTDRPILYRNFLEGLSARGIAVGYPGGLNIAWDADSMSLAKAWQGQFIDASMHWRDRGVGRQRPLGDLILPLESAAPVAVLENENSVWPTGKEIANRYRFKGYRLDESGQPAFRYWIGAFEVIDKPELSAGSDGTPGLKRTLTIRSNGQNLSASSVKPDGDVWVRIASGEKIESDGEGTWQVDGKYRVTLPADRSSQSRIRDAGNGKQELLLPLGSDEPVRSLEYIIRW